MKIKISIFIALLIVILNFTALSQNPSRDQEKGFVPGVPFASSDIENINLTNGNLALSFPLGSLPSGRGQATAGLFLRYNSKLWKKHIENIPLQNGSTSRQSFLGKDLEGGWNYDRTYSLKIIRRDDGLDEPTALCSTALGPNYAGVYKWRVQIEFPDGSFHEFRPVGYSNRSPGPTDGTPATGPYFNVSPSGVIEGLAWSNVGGGYSCWVLTGQDPNPYMTYYSSDGGYSQLKIFRNNDSPIYDWELSMPDGSKITNTLADGQRIYDRNGNFVRYGSVTLPDGSTATGWIDEFGRYVAKKATSSTEDTIYRLGVNGQMTTTKVRWKPITVLKKYRTDCADCDHERGQTSYQVVHIGIRVVDNIETPSGLIYTFDYFAHNGSVPYDPNGGTTNQNWSPGWGEVKSITMPSQAKTEYNFEIYEDPEVTNTGYITPTEILDWSGRTTGKTVSYNEEYDGVSTPRQDKWVYSAGPGGGSVRNPDGSVVGSSCYQLNSDEILGGYVYRESTPNGTITEKLWQFNNPSGFNPGKPVNPYVKTEYHTIPDAAGNPSLTAIKDFNYDKNGNVTQVAEYDWVAYSSIPRNTVGIVSGLPGGITPTRITKTAFYYATSDATDSTTTSANSYWNSSAPRLRNLPASAEVWDGSGNPKSRVEMTYDYLDYSGGNTKGGNLTQTKSWDSFKGGQARAYSNPLTSTNSITTSATYNSYGMPLTATDANGVVTSITYGNVAGPSGNVTDLYPTEVKNAYNTSIQQTTQTEYDFYTGLATRTTALGNTPAENVISEAVYDPFGRPILVKVAVGTPQEAWTRMDYFDAERRIVTKADLFVKDDGKKVAIQHFDQLGRIRLARTLEDAAIQDPANEADGIKVQTRYRYDNGANPYLSNGTYTLTSSPYRADTSAAASGESTMGWTLSYTPKTNRHSEVTTFAGAGLPTIFGGSNTSSTGVVQTDIDTNATTVTDQAGKQRRSITNALGQLIRVDEPNLGGQLGTVSSPNQPTYYYYNTLGKMIRVQQGVQNRYFMYDSLGRMIRVKQPEQEVNLALNTSGNPDNNSWSAGFTYDNNGNVLTTTDAKGTIMTNAYDALSRVLSRTYSDSTPSVTYTYDDPSVPFSKGKLTKTFNSVSTSQTVAFDILGRALTYQQITDGQIYTSGYRYNLSDAVIEETYPSGRVVENFLEADGDLTSVSSRVANGDFKTYASNFTYSAAGGISALMLGNGRWETAKFNSRQQIEEAGLGVSATDTSLWKVNYQYGELNTDGTTVDFTKNSGNIAKQTLIFSGLVNPLIQTYKYDSLNRLTEARETNNGNQTWIQTFGYDRYGNRINFSQNIGGQQLVLNNLTHPVIDPNTNRFNLGQGYSYDPTGNLITDAEGRQFTFNGDNKQTQVKDVNNNVVGTYFYDGDGKRVKKITNSETTIFVYSGSKLVAEHSTATPPLNPTTNYTTTDYLGSPRIITDKIGNVTSRRDFMPFGEELSPDALYRKPDSKYGVVDNIRQRFTGYQKDGETGLDFAEARMYQNQHARFTAIDPLLASGKSDNPQTFNRFVYAGNNPILRSDPTGEDWIIEVVKGTVGKQEVSVQRPLWVEKGAAPSDIPRASNIWETNYGEKGFQALDPNNERASEVFKTREEAQSWLDNNVGDERVHVLASAVSDTADAAVAGLAKAGPDFVIDAVNSGTQPGGPIGSALGIPNPLAIPNIPTSSPLEESYKNTGKLGIGLGLAVAGGAVGAESAPSVVPAAENASQMSRGAQMIVDLVGSPSHAVGKTNNAGDLVITGKQFKFRVDFKNPGNDAPHLHLEELVNGKWKDAVLGEHRIYPK